MRELKVIICSILFIFMCVLCTGCNNQNVYDTGDKCKLKAGQGLSDLEFAIYCIDGVQYIKSGYGISVYWKTDPTGHPKLKPCNCSNIK